MSRFWLGLWLRWALWLSVASVIAALAATLVATGALYVHKGMPPLEGEVPAALVEIAWFLFAIFWSLALLGSLVASVRQLFGRCVAGYRMVLIDCDGNPVAQPRLGELMRFWRRWFFAMIWIVAAQVIVTVAADYMLGSGTFAQWFSIYWLYGFILVAGLATLPLITLRCTTVKAMRC